MPTENKITVIIADDHDVYRDGLIMLLSKDEEISIAGETSNGKNLIELVTEIKPDVVITDLRMPEIDGVSAIKAIKASGVPTRCIVLSTFDSEALIIEALEAGAMGYIIKNAQRDEIVEAVKTVYAHHPYYCASTSSKLAKQISKSRFNPYTRLNHDLFSATEKEIIRLICAEKTSEEIGKILFMSKRTVEGYRIRIIEKMNVKRPVGIVIYAIKNGLYSVEQQM